MMKRNTAFRALALLLCLLLAPGTAGAITWGNYVQQVNTQIANSGPGDVTITTADIGEDTVEAPVAGDAALGAGAGYNVIIEGFTFEGGMLLSGGQIELRDVTVLNDSGHGITIVGDTNGVQIELTLDENSAIGASGAAVGGDGIRYYAMAGPTTNNDIQIHNAADIFAEDSGIRLLAVGSGDMRFVIDNSGDIHAQDDVGLYAGATAMLGDSTVRIENAGAISDATDYGIQATASTSNGSALAEIDNHGDISDITAANQGAGAGAYVFSFSGNGSATSRITNDAAITNTDGAGLATNVQTINGQATSTIQNSGTITDASQGLVCNGVAMAGDTTTRVDNSGDIDAQDIGIASNANALTGDVDISIQNEGNVHGEQRYGVVAYGNGQNATIAVENNGEASGGRSGLLVEGPAQMDLSVSGDGLYLPGSYTGPATQQIYDSTNAVLMVDYPDAGSAPQGQALEEELLGIADASGLTTLQDGTLVLVAYNADPNVRGGIHDFAIAMQASSSDSQSDSSYVAEPQCTPEPTPPPPKPRPSYQGITYSEEWLYQAYLANASRDLRVYELTTDENGLPEKGEHLVFKESLHGNIQLTLSNYSPEQLLAVVSMPMMEKLIRMNIHTLNIVGEKTSDSYPIREIYDALMAAGHGDCQYVYLAGMEADAVIIDRDGNKVAL